MPPPGQRSGSPWVVLHCSLISTKPRKCGWRGHRAVGELEGELWPLPSRPCQRRDLPHLALSVSLAALATRDPAGPPSLPFTWRGAPSPSVQPHQDLPLQLSNYIPFTKNNLDLQTCERIMGKKVRWKNVVRERASWDWGTGNRYVLPLSTHPHTHASWGAFPSAAWASSLRAARSVEGAVGAEPGRPRNSEVKVLINYHSVLSSWPGLLSIVGQVVHSVRVPEAGTLQQALCPGMGLCYPATPSFPHIQRYCTG